MHSRDAIEHEFMVKLQITSKSTMPPQSGSVRDVWAHNLEEEMEVLMELVEEYPFVAVDTEYPGVLCRPVGSFRSSYDFHYQTVKSNVDLLKIIQAAFTFFDAQGNVPTDRPCTWQFHFKFNLSSDIFSHDSAAQLEKAGIDFRRHEMEGISRRVFAELFTVAGLVLNPDIVWLSFHGGYDFAYILRMLTEADDLPEDESEFFMMLSFFFPHIIDVKYLVECCESISGGLADMAMELGLGKVSRFQLASADSRLTGEVFFKLREKFFEGHVDQEKFDGILYGLGDYAFSKTSVRLRQ